MNRFVCRALMAFLCLVFPVAGFAQSPGAEQSALLPSGGGKPNLLVNPGFSAGDTDSLDGWEFSSWVKDNGKGTVAVDLEVFNTGPSSFRLDNQQPDDSKLVQRVPVEPDSWYRAWVWVKTQNIPAAKAGANISAMDITETSIHLKGTNDWTRIEVYGKTGPEQKELELTLRLGGYGSTNTGTAWFDDAGFQKVDAPPGGKKTINWYKQTGGNAGIAKYWASPDASPVLYGVLWTWLLAFGLLVWVLWHGGLQPKLAQDSPQIWQHALLKVLGLGLVVKTVLAGLLIGYNSDMATFAAWSRDAFALGPGDFYRQGTFADYPPGYIWVLWLIGGIKSVLGVPDWSFVHLILLKLPAVLADLVTVWFVYRLAVRGFASASAAGDGRRGGAGIALAWAVALFLLCLPMVTMDSAVWGQVDSIFTLALVVALVFLEDRRLVAAAVVYAVAVLVKPQALLLAPLALVALGKEFTHVSPLLALRRLGLSVLSFVATALVIVLPFAFKQKPDWIFGLYGGTLGSYPYVSLNAPNLWTIFGLNWAPLDTQVLGMPVGTLSWILMIAALVFVVFLVVRGQMRGGYLLGGFLLTLAFFVLGPKMHERYVYPAVILGLTAWVFVRDRRLLVMTLVLGVTATINLFTVLVYKLNFNTSLVPVWDPVFILCSVVNLAMLVWAFKVGTDLFLLRRKPRDFLWNHLVSRNGGHDKGSGTAGAGDVGADPLVPELLKNTSGPLGTSRRDWFLMLGITAVFAVASFANLGSTVSPQKAWYPLRSGETVVFDFGSATKMDKAGYHWGLGTGEFHLDWSADGETWTKGPKFGNENRFVEMRWYYEDLDVTARYGRITVLSGRQELDEMAFWNGDTLLVPKLVSGSGAVFDEQSTATKVSDYYNGMYFDEVYHARAAWEYLHGKDSSENTHPPLGKLIIAAGIKIFGMNAFGWRFMGALFGVLMLPLFYLLALRLFRNTRWAAMACGLFALDFMHFAQTRISTIDTYGVFFILLSYFFMLGFLQGNVLRDPPRRSNLNLLGSGIAFGLGAASKWIVLYAAVGLLVFWLVRVVTDLRSAETPAGDRSRARILAGLIGVSAVGFLLIPLLVYTASYIPMMKVSGTGLQAMLDNQSSMYNYHSKLQATHPFSSYWYQWPVMTKPIYYYSGGDVVPKGMISSIYAFGNPVVWWAGTLAFLWLLYRAGQQGVRMIRLRFFSQPGAVAGNASGKQGAKKTGKQGGKAVAAKKAPPQVAQVSLQNTAGLMPGADLPRYGLFFIVLGGLVQYAPWAVIPRQLVFIYHFFATVPFIVLALVWVLRYLETKGGKWRTMAVLGLAFALFVYFYPVLSGATVSKAWYAPLTSLNGGWPY